MLLKQLNSFVFVGQFPHAFLDERELFDGKVDLPSVIRMSPIVQCGYDSGKFQLSLTPDRLDLRSTENIIISDELVRAAEKVVSSIASHGHSINVTGVGINCDGVIGRNDIGMSGVEYCNALFHSNLGQLADAPEFAAMCRISFNSNSLRFQARLEPDASSQGDHLFVAVNGHQDVSENDSLSEKLQHVSDFRKYVGEFLSRIAPKNEG